MKQIKTLTTILLLALFAFTSCSKDDNSLAEQEPLFEINGKTTYYVYDNYDGTFKITNNTSFSEDISEANFEKIKQLKYSNSKILQIPIYHGPSSIFGGTFYAGQQCHVSYLDLYTDTESGYQNIDCCDVPGVYGYWTGHPLDVDDGIFLECN